MKTYLVTFLFFMCLSALLNFYYNTPILFQDVILKGIIFTGLTALFVHLFMGKEEKSND
jgi:xanthine/uracil permease